MTAKFTIEDDAKPDLNDPEVLYRNLCARLFEIASALNGQGMDTLNIAGAYLATGLRVLVPELGHTKAQAYLRDLANQLEQDAIDHRPEVH
jgi:hypothetical protein